MNLTWWKCVLCICAAYWACAEIVGSMRMKAAARAEQKRWNRPPAPLDTMDLIGRTYLAVGMLVLGVFAAVMFLGCV
jgi:hypothetical protein